MSEVPLYEMPTWGKETDLHEYTRYSVRIITDADGLSRMYSGYRGTSLMRKCTFLGPYMRTMTLH